MLDDITGLVNTISHLLDSAINCQANIPAQGHTTPPQKGFSLGFGVFFAISVFGFIVIIELLKEAGNVTRKASSKIFLYIGSCLLSYELFLFVSTMLY